MADFEAKRKARMDALDEKKKRLDEMRASRTMKSELMSSMKVNLTDPEKSEEVKKETDALVTEVLALDMVMVAQPIKRDYDLPPEERSKEFTRVKCNFNIHMSPSAGLAYDKDTQVEWTDGLFGDPDNNEPIESSSSPRKKGGKGSREETKKVEEIKNEAPKLKMLSNDASKKALTKAEFKVFLAAAAPHFEYALNQTDSCDIIRDYAKKSEIKAKSKTFNILAPFEVSHTTGRPVMDIKHSDLNPDIFVVAYGEEVRTAARHGAHEGKGDDHQEHPGLIVVWNKDSHDKPEHRFYATSPVMSTMFHPTDPKILLAGCYSGQILAFDLTVKGHYAVQRSSMSGKGHKHPVYAMAMSNNSYAPNELVSVSTDGYLCHWDVTRLNEPLITVFLNYASPQASTPGYMDLGDADSRGPLNVCSMAFEKTLTGSNILFGTGSGQIFRSSLPYRTTNPPLNELFAHKGLVSSIEPHVSRRTAFKNLVLTSSLDWTVKLWNLGSFGKPLFEFVMPSYDYVCDVKWSPANPGIFSTVASGGKVAIWKIGSSTSGPFDEINVLSSSSSDTAATNKTKDKKQLNKKSGALNKSVWAKDGLSILVGDSVGKVHFVAINKSQVESSTEEDKKFETLLAQKEKEMSKK